MFGTHNHTVFDAATLFVTVPVRNKEMARL
jgi:hypothetical protein